MSHVFSSLFGDPKKNMNMEIAIMSKIKLARKGVPGETLSYRKPPINVPGTLKTLLIVPMSPIILPLSSGGV